MNELQPIFSRALDHGAWKVTDTSRAEKFTDEQLLDQVSMIPFNSGWGLVAELMKRFDRMSREHA